MAFWKFLLLAFTLTNPALVVAASGTVKVISPLILAVCGGVEVLLAIGLIKANKADPFCSSFLGGGQTITSTTTIHTNAVTTSTLSETATTFTTRHLNTLISLTLARPSIQRKHTRIRKITVEHRSRALPTRSLQLGLPGSAHCMRALWRFQTVQFLAKSN